MIDSVQPMDDGDGRCQLLKREALRRRPSLDVAPPPARHRRRTEGQRGGAAIKKIKSDDGRELLLLALYRFAPSSSSSSSNHRDQFTGSFTVKFITFRVSRRRREMYIGHARLCVCLSVPRRIPTQLDRPGCNLEK